MGGYYERNVRLTGKTRYRLNFWGKLVLQVEESYEGVATDYNTFDDHSYGISLRYRDATFEDLQQLNKMNLNVIRDSLLKKEEIK